MNLFKAYSGFIQIHDTPVLNIGVTFHCDHEMEVMRVAFRYVRLKIEAKGLELYDPKSVGRLFM